MVQLHVLSGDSAGRRETAAKFPLRVGRGSSCAMVLSDPGVFDQHFEIRFSPEGFTLYRVGEAALTLNGEPSEGGVLRNGDVIGAGLAKVQFWLGALPQHGLKFREVATWVLIFGIGIFQVYLLTRLLAMARS